MFFFKAFILFELFFYIYAKKSETNLEILYEQNFDSTSSLLDLDANVFGSRYVEITSERVFTPFENDPLELLLTDVTSITEATDNSLYCEIPFLYDSRANYFCVEITSGTRDVQCLTNIGSFDSCHLGNFLAIRSNLALDPFILQLEFTQSFVARTNSAYQVSFAYLINTNGCNDTKLMIFFRDLQYNFETIFDSSISDINSIETDRWSFFNESFELKPSTYYLFIDAINECDDDKVLIALDNIEVVGPPDLVESTSANPSTYYTSGITTSQTTSSIKSTNSEANSPVSSSPSTLLTSPTSSISPTSSTSSTSSTSTLSTLSTLSTSSQSASSTIAAETTSGSSPRTSTTEQGITSKTSETVSSTQQSTSEKRTSKESSEQFSLEESTSKPTDVTQSSSQSTRQTTSGSTSVTTASSTSAPDTDSSSMPVYLIVIISIASVLAAVSLAAFGYFVFIKCVKKPKVSPKRKNDLGDQLETNF